VPPTPLHVVLLCVVLVMSLLGGCTLPVDGPAGDETASSSPTTSATTTPEPGTSPPATATPRPSGPRAVRGQLAALTVLDRHLAVPTYDRDAFGESWADLDGNGCNQRDDVLLRDAVPGTVVTQWQGRCNHDVLAGTWVDPYTGTTLSMSDLKDLRQAQAVQIDHVVPLAEAWRSGAHSWRPQRRERFANDLSGLLAVDGPTNMSKGDDDPAAWRPRKDYQCQYAARWVDVKHRWRLGVDPSEVAALEEMLGYCPRGRPGTRIREPGTP
jgi:hypothetical protein